MKFLKFRSIQSVFLIQTTGELEGALCALEDRIGDADGYIIYVLSKTEKTNSAIQFFKSIDSRYDILLERSGAKALLNIVFWWVMGREIIPSANFLSNNASWQFRYVLRCIAKVCIRDAICPHVGKKNVHTQKPILVEAGYEQPYTNFITFPPDGLEALLEKIRQKVIESANNDGEKRIVVLDKNTISEEEECHKIAFVESLPELLGEDKVKIIFSPHPRSVNLPSSDIVEISSEYIFSIIKTNDVVLVMGGSSLWTLSRLELSVSIICVQSAVFDRGIFLEEGRFNTGGKFVGSLEAALPLLKQGVGV